MSLFKNVFGKKSSNQKTIQLFISYSHIDEIAVNELRKHLSVLEENNVMAQWTDHSIMAGDDWDYTIKKKLESADLIVFLCSKNLFNSKYIQDIEITTAIARYLEGGIRIISIILEPVAWETSRLSAYQALLPRGGTPISTWNDKNAVYSDIAREFGKIIRENKTINPNIEKGNSSSDSLLVKIYKNFYERSYYRYQNAFSDTTIDDKLKYFVPPIAVFSEEKKEVSTISSKPLLRFYALDFLLKELLSNSNKRYFLLLGDSGIGKSTLMIKLFLKLNQKQFFKRNKFDVLFLSFNDEYGRGIDRKLELISPAEQRNTILLLDGFDEDFEALKDYEARFNKLCERINGFHKVVISCKTQFFPSESGIKETGKIVSTQTKSFLRIYLTDFSGESVRRYLKKRFRSHTKTDAIKKVIALRIVQNCTKLATRPIVLFFIDNLIEDILDDYQANNMDGSALSEVENEIKMEDTTGVESSKLKSYQYGYQVYDAIIEKWINWEAVKIARAGKLSITDDEKKIVESFQNIIRNFSMHLAIDLYQLQKSEKKQNFLFNRTEIIEIAKSYNLDIFNEQEVKTSLFQSHSLLNRNAKGDYKFSHKTIREYLLANALLKEKIAEDTFSFNELDYAKKFFNEMCWDKTTHYSSNFITKLSGEGIYDMSNDKDVKLFLFEKCKCHDLKVADLILKFSGMVIRSFLLDQVTSLEELVAQMNKLDDLYKNNTEFSDISKRLNSELRNKDAAFQLDPIQYLNENPEEKKILNELFLKHDEYQSYFTDREKLLSALVILKSIFRTQNDLINQEFSISKLSCGYDLKIFIVGYVLIRRLMNKGYQEEEVSQLFQELSQHAYDVYQQFDLGCGMFSSESVDYMKYLELRLIKEVDPQKYRFICSEIFEFFLAIYLLRNETAETEFAFDKFPFTKELFTELIWYYRIQKFDNRFYPDVFISNNKQLADIKITGVFNVVFKSSAVLKYYENFSRVDIPSNGIQDITPILYLAQLKELNLSHNQIADISKIESLSRLEKLDVSDNNVTDLESIAKIPNLNLLVLSQNPISDISPLSHAINLHTLKLSENKIEDITSVSKLKKLVHLELLRNKITDIEPLRELKQLETLELYNTSIKDFSPLKDLSNLKTLTLRKLGLQFIDPLSKMSFLEKLDLGRNEIYDISSLASLKNLHSLSVDENRISTIDAIANLDNLLYLNIYFNKITDIKPLSKLSKIEHLDAHDNQIRDIFYLKDLRNLKKLQLQRNLIEDIGLLGNLTQLVELGVHGNLITDFTIVNKLPNLKIFTFDILNQDQFKELLMKASRIREIRELWVSLRRLEDMDYSYLNELKNLKTVEVINKKNFPFETLRQLKNADTLHLRDNDLEDLSFLSGMNQLQYLDLGRNKIKDISVLMTLKKLNHVRLKENPFPHEQLLEFERAFPYCEINY